MSLSASPVFEIPGSTVFSGAAGDYIEAGHTAAMEVANGTLSLAFAADTVDGKNTLFSKDGYGFDEGGHLTAWVKDGQLVIRQQTDDESRTLTVPDININAGQTYHLAVSFGADGLKIYLDGQLVGADAELKQGLLENDRELLIGASGIYRKNDEQEPVDEFDGVIANVALYDVQFSPTDMAALAAQTDPAFETAALNAIAVEELMPAFSQLHHGSETAKAMAADYGFNHMGQMINPIPITEGTDGNDPIDGDDGANAINGGMGDDVINAQGGDDIVQGYYGNDVINGGDGNDVLDGGHGEDVLDGGDGDDLLIAQADGREGYVTYDPNRDEGIDDDSADQETGKVYLDQPINADDILIGGDGADTFYFQTLINAKQKFLEEHTQDDGTIRWHGVAGENNNIHDHWVDEIGNDVIMDFDRSEGDKIVIEGHTTEIGSITYGDANGDGVADHSVIQLYSDQGNGGGAHNDDLLGTITIYGDLVTEADITHTAAPAYGIVKTVDKLNEAITPLHAADDTGPINPPEIEPSEGLLNFALVDTETDEVIARLPQGASISMALIEGRKVSIAAFPTASAPTIGSVVYTYGDHTQTENVVPYALFGDSGGDYHGGAELGLGSKSISVEVYSEKNGDGELIQSLELTFEVVEDDTTRPPSEEETPPLPPEEEEVPQDETPPDEDDETGDSEEEGPPSGEEENEQPGDELSPFEDHIVYEVDEPIEVSKSGGEMEIDSSDAFALSEGTIMFDFTANNVDRRADALFARDGRGKDDGHLVIYTRNDNIIARFQSDDATVRLKAKDVVEVGESHNVAFTFDGDTVSLYVDGVLMDSAAFNATWETADENLIIGGNNARRREGGDRVDHRFDGEINDFIVLSEALEADQIQALASDTLLAG